MILLNDFIETAAAAYDGVNGEIIMMIALPSSTHTKAVSSCDLVSSFKLI